MKVWITGSDLLSKYEITGFQLFEYVRNGLQPYRKTGRQFSSPDISKKIEDLKELKSQLADVKKLLRPSSDSRPIIKIRQDLIRKECSTVNKINKLSLEKAIRTLNDQLKGDIYNWESCELPSSEEEAGNLIQLIIDSYYKIENVSIILHEDTPPSNDEQQKIDKLISKSIPNIEKLYDIIKNIGHSGRLLDKEKKHREAVLTIFGKKNNIGLIRRDYVDDKDLYIFTGGQEKRDFVGKILKRIMIANSCSNRDAQDLYKRYRQLTKK